LYAHPEGEILIPSPEIDYAFGIGLFSIFSFKLLLETHTDTSISLSNSAPSDRGLGHQWDDYFRDAQAL